MSYMLPMRRAKTCGVCGAENSICKPEGHMDPSKGVIFIGLDRPELSVGAPEVVIPPYSQGTVTSPFAKKAQEEQTAASLAEPAAQTRRTRRTKKEIMDGHEPGHAEQGRKRGGRGRKRRQVDAPGSIG